MKKFILCGSMALLLFVGLCGCVAPSESSSPSSEQPLPLVPVNPELSSPSPEQPLPLEPVDMDNLTAAKIEALNDEEIKWLHQYGEKFPQGFVFEELEGYGLVVSSASTAEEAISQTSEAFTSTSYITTECRIEVETEYFYGLYVKWEPRPETGNRYGHDEKVVCFKQDVFDFKNVVYSPDLNTGVMGTTDKNLIKRILDYCYYSNLYNIVGFQVLRSDIQETGEDYTYTVYFLGAVYGDWGMQDEVSLYKQQTKIPKKGGVFSRLQRECLKKIYVDGKNSFN